MSFRGLEPLTLDFPPASPLLAGVFNEMRGVSWSDPASGAARTHEVLESRDLRLGVSAEVDSWTRDGIGVRELLSHDTATHLKWFVAYSAENGVAMWLHQYKASDGQQKDFGVSVHNHRYWFVSTVLYGGYEHVRYALDENDSPIAVSRELYEPPNSYIMDPNEIHRLDQIQFPTLTLIVQGPAIRHHSTVFSHDGTRQFPDFEARAGALRAEMRGRFNDN